MNRDVSDPAKPSSSGTCPNSENFPEEGCTRRRIGTRYEDFACDALEKEGYRIIKKNIYTVYGELDLLASKDGVMYFFEVRFRTGRRHGTPKESLTCQKRNRMKKTMMHIVKAEGIRRYRLGFVGITKIDDSVSQEEIEYFRNYNENGQILMTRDGSYMIEILKSLSG